MGISVLMGEFSHAVLHLIGGVLLDSVGRVYVKKRDAFVLVGTSTSFSQTLQILATYPPLRLIKEGQ